MGDISVRGQGRVRYARNGGPIVKPFGHEGAISGKKPQVTKIFTAKEGGSAKPGLWANINRRKKLGISRPKSKSTISPEAYRNMKKGFKAKDGGTPAWQRKEGKNPEGGLNKKGIASYRREHPGSKLSLAVTTKPSKLKPGSKSANRRKSFCSRMKGMKSKLTSAKTAHDPNSRINKSLRKWNC
jgi:Domain of unknown function (DUF6321)